MIIPSSQMQISANTVFFPANDQRKLRTVNQTGDPVDDVSTGFLEQSGPFYVCCFVESRLEFDHYGDLFAALSRLGQRGHDGGITTGAVKRLLDRQNVWVFCSLLDEIEHGLETFVRMM